MTPPSPEPPASVGVVARVTALLKQPLGISVVVVGLVLLVVGMTWLVLRGGSAEAPENTSDVARRPVADAGHEPNTAALYFVSEDGLALVQVEAEVPDALDMLHRARVIMEHQLDDAPRPLQSPIPAGTRLRAVYVVPGNDVFVDLSIEAAAAHPGGSLNELFTVYAIVNALTTNLPEIAGVQLLVDGQEVETLAGHVDLRHPLSRNMTWVRAPEDSNE